MNKVIHVPAFFQEVGEYTTIKVKTGEKKKGFFGGEKNVTEPRRKWKQTGSSTSKIDSDKLAEDVSTAISELNAEGFEVVTVTPMTSGDFDYKYQISSGGTDLKGYGGYGYGYGFSYTNGLIIVAKKIAVEQAEKQ